MALCLNFQLHQCSLSALGDSPDGCWNSLAQRPGNVKVWHFSATPKPSHLLTCNIDERTMGHVAKEWQKLPGFVAYLNDESEPLSDRASRFMKKLNEDHSWRYSNFSHHSRGHQDIEQNRLALAAVTHKAIQEYVGTWQSACWPNVFLLVYMRCLQWCSQQNQCVLCKALGRSFTFLAWSA